MRILFVFSILCALAGCATNAEQTTGEVLENARGAITDISKKAWSPNLKDEKKEEAAQAQTPPVSPELY